MFLDCILQSFERRLLDGLGGAWIRKLEDVLGELEIRIFSVKWIPHDCL